MTIDFETVEWKNLGVSSSKRQACRLCDHFCQPNQFDTLMQGENKRTLSFHLGLCVSRSILEASVYGGCVNPEADKPLVHRKVRTPGEC